MRLRMRRTIPATHLLYLAVRGGGILRALYFGRYPVEQVARVTHPGIAVADVYAALAKGGVLPADSLGAGRLGLSFVSNWGRWFLSRSDGPSLIVVEVRGEGSDCCGISIGASAKSAGRVDRRILTLRGRQAVAAECYRLACEVDSLLKRRFSHVCWRGAGDVAGACTAEGPSSGGPHLVP